MKKKNLPWIIALITFLAIGLSCVGLILIDPHWTIVRALTSTHTETPLTASSHTIWVMYRSNIAQNTTELDLAMQELRPLFQNPRFGQDDWAIAVAARFATVQAAYEKLANTTPPDRAKEAHLALLDVTKDCYAFTKQTTTVADFDRERVESVRALIETCHSKLTIATNKILEQP